MTKFLNISVDNTLGGNSPSDVAVSSQKAVKEYVDAHSGGGGSTAVDNLSITRNPSLQIQTVGVIDSNNTTNAIKTWTGIKNQYDAIVSKDANTLYNITDTGEIYLGSTILSNYGANTSLSNLVTAGQEALVDLLYPVGSVYIGTSATCPLATIKGTWTLVSSGRVLQGADANHAAGTTIEAGLPNITGSFSSRPFSGTGDGAIMTGNGAFVHTTKGGSSPVSAIGFSGTSKVDTNSFNASRSSSIYGNSTTVQPPAYVVNIWERTA